MIDNTNPAKMKQISPETSHHKRQIEDKDEDSDNSKSKQRSNQQEI